MALQITYSADIGIDLATAYARIESITIENPRTETAFLTVRVEIFADAAASSSGKKPAGVMQISGTNAQHNKWVNACVAGANPINLIYNFLKNHAPFIGAIDV